MEADYVVHVKDNTIVSNQPLSAYLSEHQINAPAAPFELGVMGYVLIFVVLFAAFCGLVGSIVIVKQQSIKVIEFLGKFRRVATAGLSFKIPFLMYVAGELDLRLQELAEEVVVKTSDNAFVRVPVRVQYKVVAEKAQEAFYQLSNAEEQIKSYTVNIIRSTASDMDMTTIYKSKDTFEKEAQTNLNERFSGFGYQVVNVLVDNPIPSTEVIASFDRVISSQRLKEAAVNEAEAIRIKTVAGAQAEAESLTLKAKAYVTQRTTIAEGMADIIESKDLADYLIGIDWRDTVRDASQHGSVIMVPIDMSGANIASTVAALKGVAK